LWSVVGCHTVPNGGLAGDKTDGAANQHDHVVIPVVLVSGGDPELTNTVVWDRPSVG